jgi:hypothetical protein
VDVVDVGDVVDVVVGEQLFHVVVVSLIHVVVVTHSQVVVGPLCPHEFNGATIAGRAEAPEDPA